MAASIKRATSCLNLGKFVDIRPTLDHCDKLASSCPCLVRCASELHHLSFSNSVLETLLPVRPKGEQKTATRLHRLSTLSSSWARIVRSIISLPHTFPRPARR